MSELKRFWKTASLSALVLTIACGAFLSGWTAGRGTMVIFSANWCASCREIVPVLQEVAQQNGLSVTQIDVDSPSAPKQANSLGLSIPSDEPPQAYFVDRGRKTMIYNGKGYKFGYQDAARASILQALQPLLK